MINALEPVMAQHRLVFNSKAIKDKETQHQITRLTAQRGSLRQDDRVDVLSAAVNYWEDTLGLNVDQAVARNRARDHQEQIDEWLSDHRVYGLLGNKASGALRLQSSKDFEKPQNKWSIRRGRNWS